MLLLLPPSETKRPGGDGPPLEVPELALPSLAALRTEVLDALVALARDENAAARVLKLTAGQRSEVAMNAAVRSAPTMPAIDRNTGVLYDALDSTGLDGAARRWLGGHAMIHTAALGPVGALDSIPPIRLSAGISLPGLPSQRRLWADAVTAALRAHAPRFVVDLRSEAYAALGPVPAEIASVYIRVVADGPDGTSRALNHFNKRAKGEFVRALAQARPRAASRRGLLRWALQSGIALREGADVRTLELVDRR